MNIWIIDHYSVPVKYYPLARNTNFAKNLIKMGNEVIIFAASTVHNSDINLIEDGSKYKEIIDDGVKYVVINCHQYSGNGIKRILNMYEFANKLELVCNRYTKPDAIIATSMTLQACKKGIQIGQKYGCKKIAQITDLWPETLIAYGKVKKMHPLVLLFRRIEKWIYRNADKIVFSMGGAYDYIQEQGWQNLVPKTKVHYINNGVDLQAFDYNKQRFQLDDSDLSNKDIFKVVYVGSIRNANNLSMLIDAAKLVKNGKIRFLFWGDGDQVEVLRARLLNEGVNNVKLKGKVDKKYIPYITSSADLNIVHGQASPIMRFGMSMNKFFDYLAAGRPILVDFDSPYNPVIESGAAIVTSDSTKEEIAKSINYAASMSMSEINVLCKNSRTGASQYDFVNLTNKLYQVIEEA